MAKGLGIGKAGLSGKIDRIEKSMTKAYRAAEAGGKQPVTIAGGVSGSVGATTTTAGEVAASLRTFDLNVANYSENGGGDVFARTTRSLHSITFFGAALAEGDHGQQVTTLHEGLHATVATG